MNFDPELIEKSLRVLAEQGSPDEIAAFLQARGIKGLRGEADRCVVSRYLRQEAGLGPEEEDDLVAVSSRGVTVTVGMTSEDFDTPDVVGRFIARFDADHYPALSP